MLGLGHGKHSAFQPLGGFTGPLYKMASQLNSGGFVGYNSYPSGIGSSPSGYPNGFGYPGFDSVNGFSFAFRKHLDRIDWKKLASVDVDSVARNLDFQALQDNIVNIAFCNLESEVDLRYIDPNYVKLFRLAQLMIEYLLHSQDYLWSKMQEIQQDLIKEKSEHETLKKEVIEKLKTEIAELKKELHQRKKIIAVQQQLLHSGNDAIHKCQFCSKAFVNISFLQAHISRRHPEYAYAQKASSIYQPTEVAIKASPLLNVMPPLSHEMEKELLEIRERLRLTESQLVEERNARNAATQKELKEKEQLDEEMMKRFESWKQTQINMQTSEIEKVQNMFMKELKNMSSKLQSAEENLEEFKQKRMPGSMLGSLKDDIDTKEFKRQRKQMAEEMRKEVISQVSDVEARMQKKMLEQERLWKKKMRDLKLQDNQMMRQMNEEMEKLKEEEGRRLLRDQEDKDHLENEVMQRMSKIYNNKRNITEEHRKPEPQLHKEKTNVMSVPPMILAENDTEEEEDALESEYEDEEDDKNDDYNKVIEAQAAHLKTLEDDNDDDFPVSANKERLLIDPDLIKACRNDELQNLELKLEALGILKSAVGVSNENYLRNIDTLNRERNRKSKGKQNDLLYAIRKEKSNEVNQKAGLILKERMKSTLSTDSGRLKTPRSARGIMRSKSQPASLPPQQAKRTPKPSPRTGTLPAKMSSTGQSMMTTQSFTSTGTLFLTGASLKSETDLDDVRHGPTVQKRSMESRPRAKTPPGAKMSSNTPAGSHLQRQMAAKQESNEDSSDWDETSNIEPSVKARTPRQSTLASKAGSTVTQRKLEIEQQLMARDVKKPVGGVDITPMKSVQSYPVTQKKMSGEAEDIDALSLTSVSATDDVKPKPKPRQTNIHSSVQSSNGPTVSSNSYGTSKWGSSVSTGDSLSSFDDKKNTELKDVWNDDDDDED